MTVVAPTITTDNPAVYQQRLDEFLKFASRIQIDITDGKFAPSQTINLNQVYWPERSQRKTGIDLHLMLMMPLNWLDQIVSLAPDKVIVHAESYDAHNVLPKIFSHLHKFGIAVGLALLPATQPEQVKDLITEVDGVLIFGGHLGYQGGVADLHQLSKVQSIKVINEQVAIEWDGGANLENVATIAKAGVDQINIGSAISSADNPHQMYDRLIDAIGN